jgi:PAS domain S-box-containing protein
METAGMPDPVAGAGPSPNGSRVDPPITILHVDDDEAGRCAISALLRDAGFQAMEAGTGAEALSRAAEKPDLIVLDVTLPDLDGFEVCHRIKTNPITCTIPVLYLSGHFIESRDKVRGFDAGGEGYLTKPVDPDELLANIKALLRIRRAERALHESEARLRLIAANTTEAVFAYDMHRRLIYVNPAVEQLTGYSMEELRQRNYIDWLLPEDSARMRQLWEDVFKGKAFSGEELRILTRQGELKWSLSSWKPLCDEQGRQIGVQGSERDITERKRAEDALRDSEARLRMLLEQLPACLWSTDTELRITSSVGAGLAALGLKPHQLVGTSLYDYLQTDDPNDPAILPHRRAIAGESLSYESEWRGRYFQTHLEPLRDAQGTVTGSVGLAFDITERHRAEQAVRDSQRLLQVVTEGTPAAIYLKDRHGRFVWVNAAAAATVGRRVEEVIGKDVAAFQDPETVRRVNEDDRRIMASGHAETYEQVVTGPNGTQTYLTTKVPHRDEAGNIIGLLGVSRDISDRKRLEEQLRQAQKMEAIGRLAGGVAHDFNNLLTAIMGYSDLILMDCPDPEFPTHGHAEEIKRAAERAASLTRQLLAYSRQQVLSARVLNLNTIVADMEKMLRRLIGKEIELVTRLDPALRRVTADPGQVEQVLLNLVLNARDAMPDGGELTIDTANVELDDAYAWAHVDVRPGAYVRLSVADTGCGMTEEVRRHVFEPFFTTKEIGKGTGLGLATVYGIVKQSGGHVEVVSAPGCGAVFQVFLPHAREPGRAEDNDGTPARLPTGSETILLVEDEEAVRTLARSVLRRHGYQVMDAGLGTEALQLCEQHAGPIHLVVTDVVMPHMNGRELHQQLCRCRPAIKVLYISGYPGDAIGQLGVLEPGCDFLPKPFAPDALVRKVRELLDR